MGFPQTAASSASNWAILVSNLFPSVDASLKMRISSTACHISMWKSSSSLMCKYSSSKFESATVCATTTQVAVCVESDIFSGVAGVYKSQAEIHGVTTTGGQILSLQGSKFGNAGVTNSLRIRWSTCSCSTWLSDSSLGCKTVAGQPDAFVVIASVHQQKIMALNQTHPVSYESPNLKNVQKMGNTIQLNGNGFGLFQDITTKTSSVTRTVFREGSVVAATLNIAEEYKRKTILSMTSRIEFSGANRLDKFYITMVRCGTWNVPATLTLKHLLSHR
jgi:hypothetical protein